MARTKATQRAAEEALAERQRLAERKPLATKAARKQAAPPEMASRAMKKSAKKPKKAAATTVSAARYVVSSLEEWVPDRFHGYQGPGERKVHGAYATAEAANEAAREVFFKSNPWGSTAIDMQRNKVFEHFGGPDRLLELSVCPPDSERWCVKVERIGG